ncbi:LPS translocon maturation chaperone LptM [Halioglobus sp. Uisw_031]|uniref:LPS translocon maturation chaperone LptM n=1 Tax=Halioglobus sp. Uisw_031 TaxID=3230977 RepID=UPI0039E74C01
MPHYKLEQRMPYSHIFMLIALTIGVLGGCGQTGALYMPSEEAPRPPAAPVDGAEQKNKAS